MIGTLFALDSTLPDKLAALKDATETWQTFRDDKPSQGSG
jgi:hypothetical protein